MYINFSTILPSKANNDSVHSKSNLSSLKLKSIQSDIFNKSVSFGSYWDPPKSSSFIEAIKSQNKDEINSCLNDDIFTDINGQDNEGNTPLITAALYNDLDTLHKLLSNPKIKPNLQNKRGDTALISVCSINASPYSDKDHNVTKKVIEELLQHPATDPTILNNEKETALDGLISNIDSWRRARYLEIMSEIGYRRTYDPVNDYQPVKLFEMVALILNRPEIKPISENLIYAAETGDLKLVKRYLATPGIDVNKKDKYTDSALNEATINNHVNVVRELLKHPKIDPNIRDGQNGFPLAKAAFLGFNEIIEELLKHPKTDPTLRNGSYKTALDLAKQGANAKGYELLLRQPSVQLMLNPDAFFSKMEQEIYQSQSPQQTYPQQGYPIQPQESDYRGSYMQSDPNNDLRQAVKLNDIPQIKKLLQVPGIDPEIINDRGESALSMARKGRNSSVISLIEGFINKKESGIQESDEYNRINLDLISAAMYGDDDTVKELLNNPLVDLDFTDEEGNSAVSVAREEGFTNTYNLLIDFKKNSQELEAIKAKYFSMIEDDEISLQELEKILLSPILDLDKLVDDQGKMPIHHLAKITHPKALELVKVYIDRGGNINAQDMYKNTALMDSISVQNDMMTEFLIKNQADPNIPNNAGDTTLHYAHFKNNKKIIKLLEENGAIALPNLKGNLPSYYDNKES